MTERPRIFGGLLSGTSLDGVDAILLSIRGTRPTEVAWEVVGFRTETYTSQERAGISRAIGSGGARELASLRRTLAHRFAEAFRALLEEVGIERGAVTAVGSHGQTVWHEPPGSQGNGGTSTRKPERPDLDSGWDVGTTLQIDDPACLAERLGCPVVSDFRSRDMAAGGHGAPLVPWCDWVLLKRPGVGRAIQNLGGMGNVTYLPRDGDLGGVLGFDTGPGVALLDGAVRMASDGSERWDEEGRRAEKGTIIPWLLEELLSDPFFRESPPRSTGRERFGDARLRDITARLKPETSSDWDDLLATLAALTVRSIAGAYQDFLPASGVDEVVLAGGGARNATLVKGLSGALHPLPVRVGAGALGMDPDAREAAAFALLAWAHLEGIPGNLPGVTGAQGARVLGSLTPGGPLR